MESFDDIKVAYINKDLIHVTKDGVPFIVAS